MKRTVNALMTRSIPTGTCRLWVGLNRRTQTNKPLTRLEGGQVPMTVQRAAWLIYHREVPAGMKVVTTCGNTMCVAEDHLTLLPDSAKSAKVVSTKDQKSEASKVGSTETSASASTETSLSPIIELPPEAQALATLVAQSVTHEPTRKMYRSSTEKFLKWCSVVRPQPWLTRQSVQNFRDHLTVEGVGYSRVNQVLTAVRALAREALYLNQIDHTTYEGIKDIKGVQGSPKRRTWLTSEEFSNLLKTEIGQTPRQRLKAQTALRLMAFTGLRVREIAELTWDQIGVQDDRPVLRDVDVKSGGKKRITIGLPQTAAEALIVWKQANVTPSGVGEARIFDIGVDGLRDIVRLAGNQLKLRLTPHDLRRTYARLAHSKGASLDALQQALGHADAKTTLKYIGDFRSLKSVPGDLLTAPEGATDAPKGAASKDAGVI